MMKHFKFNRKRKKDKENITFSKENCWRPPDLSNISIMLHMENQRKLRQLKRRVK